MTLIPPRATQKQYLSKMFDGFMKFIKDSNEWLDWAKKKSIFHQLENRKINTLSIHAMISTAAVGLNERETQFHVYFNEWSNLEYMFWCLGHEIAHTFAFDLTKEPILETFDHNSKKFRYYQITEGKRDIGYFIEDLCDAFARKWLKINTKEKIAKDCKGRNDLLAQFILFLSNSREENCTL